MTELERLGRVVKMLATGLIVLAVAVVVLGTAFLVHLAADHHLFR